MSSIGFIYQEDLILKLGSRPNLTASANPEKMPTSLSPSFLFRNMELICHPALMAYGGLSEI